MTVYPFIEAEKAAGHKVQPACALLKVSRAAYYEWRSRTPSRRAEEDAALTERIRRIYTASRGTYGAPRVHAQLKREGYRCGRKRVARLMANEGLVGRQRRQRKQTTIGDPGRDRPPDLLQRRFASEGLQPNEVWVGDISYLRTWEGWCYLATVIDLASRRVVGFAVADHMRAELVRTRLPGPRDGRHLPPTRGGAGLSL